LEFGIAECRAASVLTFGTEIFASLKKVPSKSWNFESPNNAKESYVKRFHPNENKKSPWFGVRRFLKKKNKKKKKKGRKDICWPTEYLPLSIPISS
jgi:hypothetical protein